MSRGVDTEQLTNSVNPYAPPQAPADAGPRVVGQTSFRRIMNTGLRLYLSNFASVAIITICIWTPLELLAAYMEYFVFDAEDLRSSFRLHRGLENFFGILAEGGVIALGAAAMRGDRLSPFEALSMALDAWPRLFWTRLIRGLWLLLMFLALIVPGIYFTFRLVLAEQVAMLEHRSGVDCLKRAYAVSHDRFWLLAAVTALPYAVLLVIVLASGIPLAVFPFLDHWLLSAAQAIAGDVLMQLPTLILLAAYAECLPPAEAAFCGVAKPVEPPSISQLGAPVAELGNARPSDSWKDDVR